MSQSALAVSASLTLSGLVFIEFDLPLRVFLAQEKNVYNIKNIP